MNLIIALVIGVIVVYFINFNKRDRRQDYKLDPTYRGLVGQDKMRMDIIMGFKVLIIETIDELEKQGFKENTHGIFVLNAINTREEFLNNNIIDIASQYRVSVFETIAIIGECCENIKKEIIKY